MLFIGLKLQCGDEARAGIALTRMATYYVSINTGIYPKYHMPFSSKTLAPLVGAFMAQNFVDISHKLLPMLYPNVVGLVSRVRRPS